MEMLRREDVTSESWDSEMARAFNSRSMCCMSETSPPMPMIALGLKGRSRFTSVKRAREPYDASRCLLRSYSSGCIGKAYHT